MNILAKLKKSNTPKKRHKLLLEQRERNITYFKKRDTQVAEFIENGGSARFEIDTSEFIDIFDVKDEVFVYPQGGLLEYVEKLGNWHHSQWLDKLEMQHRYAPGIEHGDRIIRYLESLYTNTPYLSQRFHQGVVKLPKMKDGRRFSGTCAFVGIGAGLHIMHYLQGTLVRDMILIEPDIDYFILSCFFLDYTSIQKNGRLVLHLGPDIPEQQVSALFSEAPITVAPWLRILPGYPSSDFDAYIQRFHLRWIALTEIFVPFDREVRNVVYGMENILAKKPVIANPPKLSDNSRVAVIGSGPSLENDLDWLKVNQDNLIIFSAHSATKVLLGHGIRPDFICSLDTEMPEDTLTKLKLDFSIPLLNYYKASPTFLDKFEEVYLVTELYKANPMRVKMGLIGTHPTTGNLAVATAVFSSPRQLFLLGLDLGFQDATKGHVKGFWSDADELANTQTGLAQANFSENQGKVFTQSYHDTARLGVEGSLSRRAATTEVFNLSDGVKIQGATPRRSRDIELAVYPEKSEDLATFKKSFSTNYKEVFEPYETKGEKILETLHDAIKEAMTMKKFDWREFCQRIDGAWIQASQKCSALASEPDDRVEVFSMFIHDLLTEWYRLMILTQTPKESEALYHLGLERVLVAIQELEWPDSLDFSEKNTEEETSESQ